MKRNQKADIDSRFFLLHVYYHIHILEKIESIYNLVNSYKMKKPKHPDQLEKDRHLWKKLGKSDERAFEVLFRTHYPFLYDYGMRLVSEQEMVEDGIQEVFSYLWDKRRQLSEVQSVRAYLLVSLRRKLSQMIRRQENRELTHENFIYFFEQETTSLEEDLIRNEQQELRKRKIEEVFQQIPGRMRETLYHKKINGLSYKEISKIMDISPQVARNYVTEAFRRVKKIFLEDV